MPVAILYNAHIALQEVLCVYVKFTHIMYIVGYVRYVRIILIIHGVYNVTSILFNVVTPILFLGDNGL